MNRQDPQRGAAAITVAMITAAIGIATIVYLNLNATNNLKLTKATQASDNVHAGNLSAASLAYALMQPKSSPSQLYVPSNPAIMPNVYFDHYFSNSPQFQGTPFVWDATTFNNYVYPQSMDEPLQPGWNISNGVLQISTGYMQPSNRSVLAQYYSDPSYDYNQGQLPLGSPQVWPVTPFSGGTTVQLTGVTRAAGSNLIQNASIQLTTTNPLTGTVSKRDSYIPVSPPPTPTAEMFLVTQSGTPLSSNTVSGGVPFSVRIAATGIVDRAVVGTTGLQTNCGVQNIHSNNCGGWLADSYRNDVPSCVWQCDYAAFGAATDADENNPNPQTSYPLTYTVSGPDGTSYPATTSIDVVKSPTCSMFFTSNLYDSIQEIQVVPGQVIYPFVAVWGYTYADQNLWPVELIESVSLNGAGNVVSGQAAENTYWNTQGSTVVLDPSQGDTPVGVLFPNTNTTGVNPPLQYSDHQAYYIPYQVPTNATPGSTLYLAAVVRGPGSAGQQIPCHTTVCSTGSCTEQGTQQNWSYLQVDIQAAPPPSLTCSINNGGSSQIMSDQDANISWTSSGATACTVNGVLAGLSGTNVSANAIAGGSWPDAKQFTLNCTNGVDPPCNQQTTVTKRCWCAGGPARVADVLGSQAEAQACMGLIQHGTGNAHNQVPGGRCKTCATYGICSCNGRPAGWHYPHNGSTSCVCFDPAAGDGGSWLQPQTFNMPGCIGG